MMINLSDSEIELMKKANDAYESGNLKEYERLSYLLDKEFSLSNTNVNPVRLSDKNLRLPKKGP